ncbi:hypothetical protein FWD07_01070 [Candidatus Saccharibacteria bacterium]|nr:hypothetical protein [Candidatus Saccharibacteria bacterium]
MIKKIFSTEAAPPRLKGIRMLGCLLVTMILIAVVVQVMALTRVGGGIVEITSIETETAKVLLSPVWIGVAVLVQLLALPFIVGMKVSPLMRLMSMAMGWLAAVNFLVSVLVLNLTNSNPVVVFAEAMGVPLNGLFVLLSVMIAVAMGWMTWGRWPSRELNLEEVKKEQEKLAKKDKYASVLAEARKEAGVEEVAETDKEKVIEKPKSRVKTIKKKKTSAKKATK